MIAFALVLTLLFGFAYLAAKVSADPVAASITNNYTKSGPTSTPANRSDDGGTITWLTLDGTQQNTNWKGYVGNVTGSYTLDDPNGRTLYDWSIIGTITGEVYAGRNSSVDFGTINCSNQTSIDAEQSVLSMASADSDSINRTFNETNHVSFLVGTRNMSSCRSTAMYLNDTRQSFGPSVNFQEVLLHDDGLSVVYAAPLVNNQLGFDNSSIFDFEMILAENGDNATPTTYFFWVEIGE